MASNPPHGFPDLPLDPPDPPDATPTAPPAPIADLDTLTAMLGNDPEHGSAAAALVQALYGELRALAGHVFRGQSPNQTLQPTALVNEAYLRLARQGESAFRDREHFLAVAAMAMRQVLVDHARRRASAKRGGDRERLMLGDERDERDAAIVDRAVDVVELDEALNELARLDARKAQVVTMRFFGGLTNAAIGTVLGVSASTVSDDWVFARAWLLDRLGGDAA